MAEKKLKPLSHRERALLKNLSKGMSITDAALQSGYSKKYAGQCGSQAIENIRIKAPQLLAKHGLDDDTLIEKYLKPALEANETEFAKFEGKITDSREVIAWGPRLQALDMTAKIRGLYVQPAEQSTINLRDVTFNVIYEKRDKPKTLDASIHDSSS